MSRSDLGYATIVGLGIWLVVQAAWGLPGWIAALAGGSDLPASLGFGGIGQLATQAALGCSLLLAREPLTCALFGQAREAAVPSAPELVAALLSALGVWLCASPVVHGVATEVLQLIARQRAEAEVPRDLLDLRPVALEERVREATRFLVGVAVFLGAPGLAGLWQGLRGTGRPSLPDDVAR
jgi:hypothetical protein